MAELQSLYVTGFECDKRGCSERIEGKELPPFVGQQRYMVLGEAEGWTFWYSRSRRSYCPQHGPSPASGMRQIHPRSNPPMVPTSPQEKR